MSSRMWEEIQLKNSLKKFSFGLEKGIFHLFGNLLKNYPIKNLTATLPELSLFIKMPRRGQFDIIMDLNNVYERTEYHRLIADETK